MFKLEIKDNIYKYIDTNCNNKIEIQLNLDPILDCNLRYSNEYLLSNFDLLKYAVEDIKQRHNSLTYISKYNNEKLYNNLEILGLKIKLYDYVIPFMGINNANYLEEPNQIKEAQKYILKKLNKKAKINSKHLNDDFIHYTEKIFDIEKDKYTIKIIKEEDIIKGAVEYFVTDKVYIRNIYADNTKFLKDIIDSLLKFKQSISLSCMFIDKELLTVIKEYKGILEYTYFIWKEEK